MCGNTSDGFNNDSTPFITWYKPTDNVTTLELVFRDAQIADLKIFHLPEKDILNNPLFLNNPIGLNKVHNILNVRGHTDSLILYVPEHTVCT